MWSYVVVCVSNVVEMRLSANTIKADLIDQTTKCITATDMYKRETILLGVNHQLVDHSLHFLGVIWIVHSEVTNLHPTSSEPQYSAQCCSTHVDLLSSVGRIHVCEGVATGTWAGSALAYVGGIFLHV